MLLDVFNSAFSVQYSLSVCQEFDICLIMIYYIYMSSSLPFLFLQ